MENKTNYIEQIKLIAETLELGIPKVSNKNLQMLCPFHNEHNASFGINITDGTYNCLTDTCRASGKLSILSEHLKGHIIAEKIKIETEEDLKQYKVKTYIDANKYKQKPNNQEYEKIVGNINPDYAKEYTLYDLIYYIINGHTIAPAGIKSSQEWKQQQIIMLDFDNKDTNFSMEEVWEYSEKINLVPTFSYYTFSNMEYGKEKFRFVYCFKEPITDIEKIKSIINNLYRRFNKYKPDLSCKDDLSKKFLGTNNRDVKLGACLYSVVNKFSAKQLNEIDSIIKNVKGLKEKDFKEIISFTARELLSKELPPLPVMVENMLYQGLTILGGAPKAKKSWLCLDACLSISSGKSFLNFHTIKCECLYLALEDSERRLQNRIKLILGNNEVPDGFHIETECPTLDNNLIKSLENYLLKFPKVKLIIIDTLQMVRGIQGQKENCYAYDYRDGKKLKSFADTHGICILVVHHLRKQKDTDIFNQLSGSTGLTGVADTIIILEREENQNEASLYMRGRDIEEEVYKMRFGNTIPKWEIISNDTENLTEQERYNGNPIVKTIKKLSTIHPEGFEITSDELLKEIPKLTGVKPKQKNSSALSREINNKISKLLLKYDSIHYEPPNANGGSSGRKMYFSKPIIKEEQQENKEK